MGKYPNTYVYTKNLAEQILKKEKPSNMTLTIVRPSIVGSSYSYPVPGWVDNISASGAIFLFAGLGVLKHLNGKENIIGDNVPVDYVSDFTIAVGALKARTN